jgi:hypothetical protein
MRTAARLGGVVMGSVIMELAGTLVLSVIADFGKVMMMIDY